MAPLAFEPTHVPMRWRAGASGTPLPGPDVAEGGVMLWVGLAGVVLVPAFVVAVIVTASATGRRRRHYVRLEIARLRRYVRTDLGEIEYVEHLDGIEWHAAPVPRRSHVCWAQSRGYFLGSTEQRCACGATRRSDGDGWRERNSRRRGRNRGRAAADHRSDQTPRGSPGGALDPGPPDRATPGRDTRADVV